MDQKYKNVIDQVSSRIAGGFPTHENDMEKRASLLDADIAEITRQIGSETAQKFGSEESFGHAAQRFGEHYRYDCSCSTVSRVTKQIAEDSCSEAVGEV